MSMRYKGGVISATPPTTSASSAIGVWTLEQQLQATAGSGWPVPPVYWIGLAYGSATNDTGYCVAPDSSLNMYAVGFTNTSGSSKGQVIKYTNAGTVSWQKEYDQPTGTGFKAAICDSSNNLYVGGNQYIVKLNSSGTIQAQKTLSLSSTGVTFQKFAVDSSSNIYAAGGVFLTDNDIFVAKFDSSLALQWGRLLRTTTSVDTALAVATDSSANVYVGGYTNSPGPSYGFQIEKYDTSGTIQWQRLFTVSGNSAYGYGIAVDSNANVYCVGYLGSGLGYIIKYDTSGTLQWQRSLNRGSGGTVVYYAACTDASDNVYATGYINPGGGGGGTYDVVIVKYNSSGTLQWQRYLSSYSSAFLQEYGQSIAIDAAGLINLVGSSNKSGTNDFLVIKLPADGSKTGTYTVAGYSFTYAALSATDAAGTGTSAASSLVDSTPTNSTTTPTGVVTTTSLTSSVTTL